MKTFEELGVSPEIRKAIEELGYENPMPVQEEVIPYLLGNGNDVVALAQTGTGKTAAFGLPLIQKIDVKNCVPQALVLCPTRELCLQIAGDLTDYSKYITDLKILPVYGGSSIDSQIRSLKRGVHIIVATPGRLIDLMERKVAQLATIRDVVMDEADEMLNMGFTDSINAILENIPQDRNTLMFSATMSPEIARIAKTYLHEAKEITVGTKNEGSKNVNHVAYIVHAKDKYLALKRVVDFYPQIYGIVFCRTRKETQEIADKLIQDGYNADSLHGELSQAQRDLVMQKFRQRHLQLLVATDVAARGLDVNDLTHVINYGLPDDTESYTHRSGRTGRAGKTGISIAIINLREKGRMKEIEHIIKKKFEVSVLPSGQEICQQQLIKVIDDIEKVKVNEEEIETFLPGIYRKLDWLDKEDLIKRVVSLEFNRFLDYYKNAPEIEQPKANEKKSEAKESRKGDKEKVGRKAEKGYTRLFLNLGKTDGFYTNQIIDLVNRNLRKERIQIGRIDLMQNFSFFEVIQEQAPQVLKALNKVVLSGGRKVCVEIAGENTGKSDKSGKKKKVAAEKKADKPSKVEKAKKPSREERGYTSPRGPKKKDDWKQFFQQDNQPLRGEEPDFSEEGWAKRSKRKK
ncbi:MULTISPECIES: DEAD/DEAH box helicase [Bacteroidaceae]|jgi:ATP-dependent RNA helicase DeaD|uniref:ATP-dependent RNA helicase n=3 Tax=Phocaeicola plebeius TaxID=310297 RepID=A0A3E4WM75_9BACT|nr:DEAD/DEAH box helicase [Phocaeicola plebeius]MBS4809520.1 DEAD/DEAH box helicase [Bacteroides sp.]MBD9353692.1 DEAD/DEAH box helicase [Phocaeicola plebeius]MBS4824014.1 DEAD/DEAH box helicase [Bacteroides sp.]RGK58501.1 ATP-dependent RNA helicase [Phocaeicola plebeius]RGM43187.1 ATP-dependent RNA helicase [Phocaeicola plebeius]